MIATFNNFKNIKKGVLLNLFVCDYNDPEWINKVTQLNNIIKELPNIVTPSKGHYKGLALQTILGVSLDDAKEIANNILEKLDSSLVVLSEIEFIHKNIPIGHYQDDSLVKPGRYFDKLVKNDKKGLYII